MSLRNLLISLLFLIGFSSCKQSSETKKENGMSITKTLFGTLPDGTSADLYTLRNANGMEVKLTNYGGIVTSVLTPDQDGNPGQVVLGFDSLQEYLDGHPYFGCIVGRYANRIADGQFELNGKTFTVARNDGENHLHGGVKGFDKVLWEARELRDDNSVGVELSYLSRDGEEGYPGNLQVRVVYRLTLANELDIYYEAVTDKPTVVNLTHHGYFNLSHDSSLTILDHKLRIYASKYLSVNTMQIPVGEASTVMGTPFDFLEYQRIGSRIAEVTGGYDHTWVLDKALNSFGPVASLQDTLSGRTLDVFSTEPGVQFYSGNFLDGEKTGHKGIRYVKHYGLCLETQHFPDSPNRKDFPSVVLLPGKPYRQHTVYRFGIKLF